MMSFLWSWLSFSCIPICQFFLPWLVLFQPVFRKFLSKVFKIVSYFILKAVFDIHICSPSGSHLVCVVNGANFPPRESQGGPTLFFFLNHKDYLFPLWTLLPFVVRQTGSAWVSPAPSWLQPCHIHSPMPSCASLFHSGGSSGYTESWNNFPTLKSTEKPVCNLSCTLCDPPESEITGVSHYTWWGCVYLWRVIVTPVTASVS